MLTGHRLYPLEFSHPAYFAIPFRHQDKWVWSDTPGNVIIAPVFQSTDYFKPGLPAVERPGSTSRVPKAYL